MYLGKCTPLLIKSGKLIHAKSHRIFGHVGIFVTNAKLLESTRKATRNHQLSPEVPIIHQHILP